MYGQENFAPQFRQGLQMYIPSAQQDRPPYTSTSFQTSTITSQAYMVHLGYSSVTNQLSQPDSNIYAHLSPFPVPPSAILPPVLHLNGSTKLMQSFPSAQQDPQWTQNVYQIPSHIPQSSPLSPGQGSSRGLVWLPSHAGVRGVQPTSQPYLPLSSPMMYAHALGPVAYTSSALVPSLPSLPPQVPAPLPPSSLLGAPYACVMNHSAILLPSTHINQFSFNPSSRPGLLDSMRNTGVSLLNTDSDVDMEDDMTHINEEQAIHANLDEPEMQDHPADDRFSVQVDEPEDDSPPLLSNESNSISGEESYHEHIHSDRNSTAPDVKISAIKADKRNKNGSFDSGKHFKAAVVKFVKKVLKPFWRNCAMTRVVFKIIVRKTVDKVLGSLKPHHIPSSQLQIKRYIKLSRSKLTALVMGYVHKYVRA
ncbi:zinc finger CCCH domain-containing protein 55 isoform X1 [Daucus carota subsp. sativus]|uniref:zinc finger CCCH domain-containing protein 55 isoform X1 n=1 Tax=Daucus carota subsp. sativus TaxID=79200 RepID=UPI0007EF6C2C|nr:PREDICTED: zinc finger CCCH domain-containing protein 55-like isoform X1 [Daucus carota subsp. sativus]XP_017242784.1 PREDICTED: zinc finger CCCH domain-containing protein 55-like isoform X1 [Daucus carota subsp. sativus]XP_017242785.1 PREDICTED: zinc finger CCCH domain-containing protein 55-like isoform X1 [Daucus carota subsp. sativus]XP_017242786.1 PREDICTED: zinc finger CCCH domain-containing protein 55-like isoform X1 [Daucus carota subsp. sativus]XP_017242787.1 PREDICTED: zinc finger C